MYLYFRNRNYTENESQGKWFAYQFCSKYLDKYVSAILQRKEDLLKNMLVWVTMLINLYNTASGNGLDVSDLS